MNIYEFKANIAGDVDARILGFELSHMNSVRVRIYDGHLYLSPSETAPGKVTKEGVTYLPFNVNGGWLSVDIPSSVMASADADATGPVGRFTVESIGHGRRWLAYVSEDTTDDNAAVLPTAWLTATDRVAEVPVKAGRGRRRLTQQEAEERASEARRLAEEKKAVAAAIRSRMTDEVRAKLRALSAEYKRRETEILIDAGIIDQSGNPVVAEVSNENDVAA